MAVYNNYSATNVPTQIGAADLLPYLPVDDEFKIRALAVALKLASELHNHCKQLPSHNELFDPVFNCLKQIPTGNYPLEVKDEIDGVLTDISISRSDGKLEYTVMEQKRPKALRLYEPNIVKMYMFRLYRGKLAYVCVFQI